MIMDNHIHSIYSGDAVNTPLEIIEKAISLNIDIIAISDHNTIKGSQIAIKEAKKYENLLVIPSIEISTDKGHMLGFGVEENIKKDLSPEETIDLIHEQGGIAIIPHPYCYYRNGLFTKIDPNNLKIDGMETKNARFIFGYSNYKSKKYAIKNDIPQLGASDAHYKNFIGNCYSDISCEKSIDSVMKSIKNKKIKPKGKGTSNIKLSKYLFDKKILKKYGTNIR